MICGATVAEGSLPLLAALPIDTSVVSLSISIIGARVRRMNKDVRCDAVQ